MIDIPGYKIVRTLGKGGMATVYLAIQESFEREVALKVVNLSLTEDTKFSERFLHEAKIVSKLMHPNIVTVYDVGVYEKRHYLSMEYVPGLDLKQQRQFLSLQESVRVVQDIAKALDYAGRKGYVHRDVKPENIMLHEDDGRAVLMDFGIACLADRASGMTQTGTAIGTPHYMSPEQARGQTVDSRSDIYSLGVVLFLLITGHVPYDADSAVAVGIKHVSEPIPQLPAKAAALQPIINKVLAKEPLERYQTGAALMVDLARFSDAELRQMDTANPESVAVSGGYTQAPTVVSNGGAEATDSPLRALTDTQLTASEEPLSVHRDDRRPYQPEPRARRWPWLLLAVVLLTGGGLTGLVVFKERLPTAMREQVDETLVQAEFWRARAYRQLGWEAPPPAPAPEEGDPPLDGPGSGRVLTSAEELMAELPEPQPETEPEENSSFTQARSLRAELDENLAVAPDLAQLYRNVMADNPEDQKAEWGLKELREYLLRHGRGALELRELAVVADHLATLQESFPTIEENESYQALVADYQQAQAAQPHLQRAEQLLEADRLASPEGNNALAAYRQALEVDPDNPIAKAGIGQVVNRYGVLAENAMGDDDWAGALDMANRGLGIEPQHEKLLEIQRRASIQRQRQRSIEELVAKAEAQRAAGELVTPRSENAVASYRELLAMDNGNNQAQAGLREIQQQLVAAIERAINRSEFERAKSTLSNAREAFPQSERWLSLQASLEEAEQADFLARQPKVPALRVNSQPMDSLSQPQDETLSVDRTIHIGFSYDNFGEETTVIQAVLYDGSRSVQIAQTPVVVSGKSGMKFFTMDRPVNGFAEGGYSIDLVRGTETLNSLAFKVKKARQ